MEPKDKAKEIYDKYYAELYALTDLRPRVAMQCALIYCDGMIAELSNPYSSNLSIMIYTDEKKQFYKQVKAQIKAL